MSHSLKPLLTSFLFTLYSAFERDDMAADGDYREDLSKIKLTLSCFAGAFNCLPLLTLGYLKTTKVRIYAAV